VLKVDQLQPRNRAAGGLDGELWGQRCSTSLRLLVVRVGLACCIHSPASRCL